MKDSELKEAAEAMVLSKLSGLAIERRKAVRDYENSIVGKDLEQYVLRNIHKQSKIYEYIYSKIQA